MTQQMTWMVRISETHVAPPDSPQTHHSRDFTRAVCPRAQPPHSGDMSANNAHTS